MGEAERVAAAFHASYERQAPHFGYRTREASAVPWEQVPDANRALMVSVVQDLLDRGFVASGLPVMDGRDDDLYRQVVEEMDHPNRLADRIVQVVAEFGPAGVCRPTIRGRVLAPGEPHGKLYVALVGALESGLIELVPGSAPEGRYRVPVR